MSDANPAIPEALRWLQFSKTDLVMALKSMSDPSPSPHHACWNGQQSVEKVLKAALILEGISFPHTHDLDALKNLLPKRWKIRNAHRDLSELSTWAISSRYPSA